MKTQISKDGFRAERRYSGVYQQQGRLITDSDWNEMVDVLKARVDDAMADVIGNGAPEERAADVTIVGNTLKIKPGVVFAGGVQAQVVTAPGVNANPFGFNEQADFPSAPLPPANSYKVYADVWERAVVSLEDDELRDPALHGADTCTRTQTMAQIKWCPQTKDPENPVDNPTRGNATLTVAFAEGGDAGLDPCDPQAAQVDPVGGDFLLRVEVHDVHWPNNAGAAAPDRVVIKWSRENGAEQYAFEEMPDWFKTGPWRYELYNTTAEKHLGYHLAGGFGPTRGELTATLPQAAPAPNTLVRRWDGYVVAEFLNGAWGPSDDADEDPEDTAPNTDVDITGGNVIAGLGGLDLTLVLQGKVLLPGDAWLVPVRRAVFEEGEKLLDNAQPTGIRHRYVTLGEVLTNGTLKARTAAEKRRFAFPRLTDLGAADIGFPKPCNTSVYQGATVETVADALKLLCGIKAEHVEYENAQVPTVKEVKAGLDDLYTRVGQTGNRFLVGPGGYPTIEDALKDLGPQTNDIALALAPGVHTIDVDFDPGNLQGKHLSILGVGQGSRIKTDKINISFQGLASFTLDSVAVQFNSGSQLTVGAPEIVITNCRLGGSQTSGGLILPKGEGRFRFQGNWIDVPWNVTDNSLMVVLASLDEQVGLAFFFGLSHDLFETDVLTVASNIIAENSLAERQNIQNSILTALSQIGVSNEEASFYKALALAIGANPPNANTIASAFRAVRTIVHRKNPGTAILLTDFTNTVIEDNRIIGLLGLYGEPEPLSGNLIGLEQKLVDAVQGNKLSVSFMGGLSVVVHQNEITGILCGKTRVDAIRNAVNSVNPTNFTGFQRLTVTNNTFDRADNQFHAMNVNLASNFFNRSTTGWTLGASATYMGNSALNLSDLWSGVPAAQMQAVGNVRITVK